MKPRRAAHTLCSDQNPLYSDLSVNRSEYYQAVGTGDTHHITFTVTAIVTGSDIDQNVFPKSLISFVFVQQVIIFK